MRSNFFRRSFLIATITASLPAICIGILVYYIGVDYIENEMNSSHEIRLKYASARMDADLTHIETMMASGITSLSAMKPLSELILPQDVQEIQNIYRLLSSMQWSDPSINDIWLYLGHQNRLIHDNHGLIEVQDVQQKQQLQDLLLVPSNIYWTTHMTWMFKPDQSSLSLVLRLPVGRTTASAALIINLRSSALDGLIHDLEPESDSSLLWSHEGALLSAGRHSIYAPSALDQEILHRLSHMSISPEVSSFILDFEGETYSVSYSRMNRLGSQWNFATATPISKLTQPVIVFSRFIIYTSLSILCIALLLSWVASKELYRPVGNLVRFFREGQGEVGSSEEFSYIASEWMGQLHERERLRKQLQATLPQLRSGFLLQLTQGHLNWMDEQDIIQRFQSYGGSISPLFAVITLQIESRLFENTKFKVGDEALISFASSNIALDVMSNHGLEADLINFQDMTFGLLLYIQAVEPAGSTLEHAAQELAATLLQTLDVRVTVCIGNHTPNIRDVPEVMEVALAALNLKQWGEELQIMKVDDMLPNAAAKDSYPFSIEKEIMHYLRSGEQEVILNRLDHFYRELTEQASTQLQIRQGLLLLTGNMTNAILHTGFEPLELFENQLPLEQIAQIQEPHNMMQWIKSAIVMPYLETVRDKQDWEIKRIVSQVVERIQDSYMSDLSLEGCAEQFGTYPKKLSLGFKKITGTTFIDYLTRYRLDTAKQRLSTTDDKIIDIAASVGYQPQYFNRIFKKHEGMTPGQYRELHQANTTYSS
ncbi:helix-turn-helix transcriptional regulator [Paenibacillus sp. 1P07SE]|uniref:helix-turn-helix transcriptional regulator n=1 Tax=Paenibacillus sp. 1P07SE TaxID=3132209 RepID=UPI0039A43485